MQFILYIVVVAYIPYHIPSVMFVPVAQDTWAHLVKRAGRDYVATWQQHRRVGEGGRLPRHRATEDGVVVKALLHLHLDRKVAGCHGGGVLVLK